jgi:signal transduction histidine kinase
MVIPVQISAAPVYDEAGQPLYSVGHVQDIRERLAVDHMKDEFISIVSHELRTPITAIQGALMLLGAGVYNSRPQQANYMLDIAIKNSARLVRLVDDILSFERLESGKVQLEKEACEVASLMYQAVESVQPIADQSGITITLTPLTATLWAAPDEIIQVLTNLLSNAVKFSFSGSTIWLSAEVKGEEAATSLPPYLPTSRPRFLPRTYLLFTVTDQGRGIPADRLDLIFKEFQQVDASDSRKRGGTGLGLAICRRIVMRHQGHIWVKSCLGVGSTFYVALPQGAE